MRTDKSTDFIISISMNDLGRDSLKTSWIVYNYIYSNELSVQKL